MDSPIFEQFIFISYILEFNKFFPRSKYIMSKYSHVPNN